MQGIKTLTDSILENPVFSGLSKSEAEELASHCEVLVLPPKRKVFGQGDMSSDIFVLFHGRLLVSVKDLAGVEHNVGHVEQGEVFGEMGVLESQTRSASTYTEHDSIILRIPGTSFTMMVKQGHPAIQRLLQWAITKGCERLRELDEKLDELFDKKQNK